MLFTTWMFCQWIMCLGSWTYRFNNDTWKTLCTQMWLGSANRYATGPTLSNIWKGPQNLGASFAQDAQLNVLFFGLIRTYTWSPTSYSRYDLFLFAYTFCRSCAAFIFSLTITIFSLVSRIISGPRSFTSQTSAQHNGDRHGLPYNASNGAIPILEW